VSSGYPGAIGIPAPLRRVAHLHNRSLTPLQHLPPIRASFSVMDGKPNEYELALRARDGDREALAALAERTRLRLFALAYAELRHYDDAQDAVASALLQVCLHIGELRQPERIWGWMQRIVLNEAHRLRRGPKRLVESLEATEPPEESASTLLLRLDIQRALRRLPRDQAQAIRLFYLEDLSVREIADRMQRAQGTVTSWLHRGRQHLAAQMEVYAPMNPTPDVAAEPAAPRTAAILHTDLESGLLQQVVDALQTAGYRPEVITPGEPSALIAAVKGRQLIVLDEWIGGRSALELLVTLRAEAATSAIPICVLCSAPSGFTATAYATAGADHVVRKEEPGEIARLAEIAPKAPNLWGLFTTRARNAVHFAYEEARHLGHRSVEPEHLLLGLMREDNMGSGILLRLHVCPEALRTEIEQRGAPSQEVVEGDTTMATRGKRVVDLAHAEARALRNNYIGCEHLLLGLLGEGEGLAAKLLAEQGVTPEAAHREMLVVGEKWVALMEARRRLEEAEFAYRAILAGDG
jgi:RNA polymerase sigma factor (sigma-70 family)